MVTIIEWRHDFGLLYDDEGLIGAVRELAIFQKVEKDIRERFPLFRMKLVASALKVLGNWHI